ncbi:MAG: aspartate carbamoyltransferase [Candidatus Micrarchaeota archaeon]
MNGKDLISIRDLERKDIEALFSLAEKMEGEIGGSKTPLKGSVVSTLFFEPSTRTRLSFQAAAQRLGADVINFESVAFTSMAKGETFVDTIKIIDGYADLIVMRHHLEGAARLAANIAKHPVVNGGDGGNQHPTQTLIDLYTIRKIKKKIAGLNVHLVGDLKYARTMRSLLYGLGMFGANVKLVSPKGLEMDKRIVDEAKELFSIKVEQTHELSLKDADVTYVCRIQKERFADQYEAEKLQREFKITEELLKGVKDDLVILHPLPKIDEIDPAVDTSKHATYFEQARLGVPMRMAILMKLLGGT